MLSSCLQGNQSSRELDRLEESANKDLMKFSMDSCKVLHLGRNNPTITVQAGEKLCCEGPWEGLGVGTV